MFLFWQKVKIKKRKKRLTDYGIYSLFSMSSEKRKKKKKEKNPFMENLKALHYFKTFFLSQLPDDCVLLLFHKTRGR